MDFVKKIHYLIFLLLICQSCTNQLIMVNKTFFDDDPFKSNSFQFINDSVCLYKQTFKCDIDEKLKDTKTVCSYKVDKNRIILKNLTVHPDSMSIPWFKLSESQIKKCFFLNNELLEKKPLIIGAPPQISKIDSYGYINNITTDTLIYKKKTLYYNKWITYPKYSLFITIPLHEKKKS
jgi:hypothetical protein